MSVSPYQLRHGTRHQGLHQGLRHGAARVAEVQRAAATEAVGQVVPGIGVLRIPGTTEKTTVGHTVMAMAISYKY